MSSSPLLPSGCPGRRRVACAGIALLCLLGALEAWSCARAAEGRNYRGRLLVEVLRELRDGGLELVFSSAVVGDDLRVTVEPSATDPRALLDEVLAPLDLRAEEGPGGALLILPGGEGPPEAGEEGSAPPEAQPAFVTEIIVTPGRHSVVREEQAAHRTVTHDEAAFAPSTGGDVSRVVELLPGVAAPDGSAAFHVRGSLTRDVALILDGLELYDPFHLRSFHSPFSLIDNNVVDRVDLFGGGFTADYGDRHGGFVDISTLSPEGPGRGELEIGTLNSRFSYRAPLAQGSGSWLVSARGWYPEAFLDATELGSGEKLNPRFADLYAKVSFRVAPRHRLSLHGLLAYDRLSYTETSEVVNEAADAVTKNGNLWLRALSAWSPSLSSEAVLSGGRIERGRDGISAMTEAVTVEDLRTVDFAGFRYDSTLQVSEGQALKAGVDLRRLASTYRYSSVFPGNPPASRSLSLEPGGSSLGAYAAYRARLSRTLATEIGLRWDRQTYTNDNQLSPRLNAVWRPGERSELRLALGRFQQSQRIHELQIEDGETEFRRAEVAEQAEFSFEHELSGGLGLRVDGYYRRLSGLRPRYENLFEPVELFPETALDRVGITPEEAFLRGLELLVRGDEGGRLFWWASYVLSSAEDVIDGERVPRSWDQPHAGRFLIGYRPSRRWSLSLSGSLHTGWPLTPVEPRLTRLPDGTLAVELVPGERNSERYPTYARLDLKVTRSFPLRRGGLRVMLEVLNLTDRDNACCVNDFFLDPGPGGVPDVRTELGYWLGIAPSLGVLWEY